MCFDDALAGTRLDGLAIGTLAYQQTDGAQDDGLTRTGLAGNDRKACVEVDIERLNQCIVLYMNGLQHTVKGFLPIGR